MLELLPKPEGDAAVPSVVENDFLVLVRQKEWLLDEASVLGVSIWHMTLLPLKSLLVTSLMIFTNKSLGFRHWVIHKMLRRWWTKNRPRVSLS